MRDRLSISATIYQLVRTEPCIKLFRAIVNLPQRIRRYILFAIDGIIFGVALCIALSLRFEDSNWIDQLEVYAATLALLIPVKFTIFYLVGMYRTLLRYTGSEILGMTLKAALLSECALTALSLLLGYQTLPRSVQIISGVMTWALVVSNRVWMRRCLNLTELKLRSQPPKTASQTSATERIIIYGAGSAGFQLAQALTATSSHKVIAFVDDNPVVQGRFVHRIRIYAPSQLKWLINHYRVATILLAIPSASPQQRRRVLQSLKHLPIKVKTVPTISEILSGKVSLGQIRNVEISDLLGRQEVLPDPSLLRVNITDKTVMVTGAGGSIGSELCRQIAQQQPKLLVLYELNEFALYAIDTELAETYPNVPRVACLGSVTDGQQLEQVLSQHRVETVYHAAAYKHVPLVEENAEQGVLNNAYGTLTTARIADKCKVDTFVLISTDKAVRPTNVMGATKRVAELVLQALAADPATHTRFIMVRFGNVLNSNGSVVPRFRKQIAEGKPITLTHPEMTRYFMSIPEASRLVIQAGAMGQGGEVFLLDMGEPVKIYDLAVQMIELSGLVPGEDIEIEITGLRPGEKLYEELLIGGDAMETSHPKIFAAREALLPWEDLEPMLDQLFLAAYQNNRQKLRSLLQMLVPEYQPQSAGLPSELIREESLHRY